MYLLYQPKNIDTTSNSEHGISNVVLRFDEERTLSNKPPTPLETWVGP